jgi:hypothetical protein
MELEELKSLIRDAFKDVPYPGDEHIAGCSRSASPSGCRECDGIAAHFKGTTWQEHNLQTLIGCDSAVTLFHAGALHYYLPAFLLAEIDDPTELIPNVYDRIEFNYSSQQEEFKTRVRENVNLLSIPQREALIEYFKYRWTFDGEYDPDKRIFQIIDFLRS